MITTNRAARARGALGRVESGASTTRIALAVLAAVLLVACVGTFGAKRLVPDLLPSSWTAADHAEDRNRDILVATRQTMSVFLDVDYRKIDDQIEAVLARSTGSFKEQFGKAKVEYAALTRKGEAVSKGTIREIGITRADDDEALLSVAADSKVTNTATQDAIKKGEKVDGVRIYYFQVTMTHVGDKWLMSNLEVIG